MNEADLQDRWGDAFHQSAPYQTALQRQAVGKAQRHAQYAVARQQAMERGDAGEASRLQQQEWAEQGNLPDDAAVSGLDDYQNNRVNQYVNDRFAGAASFKTGLPGVVARPSSEPDFSFDFPYMNVSRFSLSPQERLNDAMQIAPTRRVTNSYGQEELVPDLSDQTDYTGRPEAAKVALLGAQMNRQMIPRNAYDTVQAANQAEATAGRFAEKQAFDTGYGSQMKMNESFNELADRLGPQLAQFFHTLPPTRQGAIIAMPPEQQGVALRAEPSWQRLQHQMGDAFGGNWQPPKDDAAAIDPGAVFGDPIGTGFMPTITPPGRPQAKIARAPAAASRAFDPFATPLPAARGVTAPPLPTSRAPARAPSYLRR